MYVFGSSETTTPACARSASMMRGIGAALANSTCTASECETTTGTRTQVDDFDEDDYTKEEIKMRNETRKILHLDGLPFASTCVRVPVVVSHSEAVHVEFTRDAPMRQLHEALRAQAGLVVSEDPRTYMTPLQAAGDDRVFVSRLRVDPTVEHGVVFWCVTDNLRKGAATNAIQIAEELLKRGLVKR